MARYDRIAPLPAPERDRTFPAWLALRDLEGRERDAELGRRARLRFLALRPVRRLLTHGPDVVPGDSYERQIEGVREELGHLSARDPERAKLAAFLHRIRDRRPSTLAVAMREIGEVAELAGHYYAAEEYYLTSLELAEVAALESEQAGALLLLARLGRLRRRWDDAESSARRAAELALGIGDRKRWAAAMEASGLALHGRGDTAGARQIFTRILERGKDWTEDGLVALAARNLCLLELTAGEPERAVEFGWLAFEHVPDGEERLLILDQLGAAFMELGLYRAAERCFGLIAAASRTPVARTQAQALHALAAAGGGDEAAFEQRREQALRAAAELQGEDLAVALIQMDLGRAALRVGRPDTARDHLRDAIAIARTRGAQEILSRAADLLTALEADTAAAAPAAGPRKASARARRIAARVEALEQELAPASGR